MRARTLLVASLLVSAACSTKEKTSARREPHNEDIVVPEPPKASASARSPGAADVPAPAPQGPLTFDKNEAAAVKKARAERRPMVIDFYAAWCSACAELDKKTFADRDVKTEGSRFVGLRIDATNEDDPGVRAMLDKYKVVGLPAVLLIDSNGVEQKRITQFVEPAAFIAALKEGK